VSEINEAEARLYHHVAALFKAHESLLGDAGRNRAFYSALERHVSTESTVLDIGSGTGVWAIAAARMGARMVVAVERDPLLVGLIKSLARENGVADRVVAVAADSRHLQPDQKFDVIVSELIGNMAFDEQIVPVMIDARTRLLKPGGTLIPESVALVAAAARLDAADEKLPAGIPIGYDRFDTLNINIPVAFNDLKRLRLITEPQDLARVDLATIEAPPPLREMTSRWRLEDAAGVNCFAVWAEATLAGEIKIMAVQTTSWTPVVYRIRPFLERSGVVEFELTLTAASNYWSATLSNEHRREVQSYSPAFAASTLMAQSRTDADLLANLQRRAITESDPDFK
jgi:predicted RNA methylase